MQTLKRETQPGIIRAVCEVTNVLPLEHRQKTVSQLTDGITGYDWLEDGWSQFSESAKRLWPQVPASTTFHCPVTITHILAPVVRSPPAPLSIVQWQLHTIVHPWLGPQQHYLLLSVTITDILAPVVRSKPLHAITTTMTRAADYGTRGTQGRLTDIVITMRAEHRSGEKHTITSQS